jgi:hypothetical protein
MLLKGLSVRALLLNKSSQGCNLHTALLNPELTAAVSIIRQSGRALVRPSATILSPPVFNTNEIVSRAFTISSRGDPSKEYGGCARSPIAALLLLPSAPNL